MIKNIILDFGGVIYQIDHLAQMEHFKRLGVNDFEKLYSQALQNPIFKKLETGDVSNDTFRKQLIEITGLNLTKQKTDAAWNSILIGYFDEAVQLLEKIRLKYNLYLLSNTNHIHYQVYTNQFKKAYGSDFNKLFKKCWWSFKIGMRKPNEDIYKFALSDARLNGSETLFVDDTAINTDAAIKTGMKTYWLKPGEKIGDLFDVGYRLRL